MVSVNWYPVIIEDKCTNCRKCVDFSGCSVFEVINDKVLVSYPEDCTFGCVRCENICPNKAILHQFILK